MPTLLLVTHTPSENTTLLRDSCVNAIEHPELSEIKLVNQNFLDTTPEDVQACDGILLGTTENFGYMAGLTKDFFERIYYPCIEKTQGLPCALYIRAGLDGLGTKQSIGRIITGLKWKLVQPTLILHGDYQRSFVEEVNELAMNFAAGIQENLF